MTNLTPERRAEINRALSDAIGETCMVVEWANVDDMRRDWIRRIAMHLAAATTSVETYDLADSGMRKVMAREATEAAAALWWELERYFASEAEQEGEGDGR